MGLFSKETRHVCYFCQNDYFELIKTIDNQYVCENCMKKNNVPLDDIIYMTLDEVIKTKESLNINHTDKAAHNTFCSLCNKNIEAGSSDYLSLSGSDYCRSCGSDKILKIDQEIIVTTSSHLPGYKIDKHIDMVCIEGLVGLGYNINYEAQSLLGRHTEDKDLKFQEAKNVALSKLKLSAFNLGGQAVVDLQVTSSVFHDKRSVVVTGSVVSLSKEDLSVIS